MLSVARSNPTLPQVVFERQRPCGMAWDAVPEKSELIKLRQSNAFAFFVHFSVTKSEDNVHYTFVTWKTLFVIWGINIELVTTVGFVLTSSTDLRLKSLQTPHSFFSDFGGYKGVS